MATDLVASSMLAQDVFPPEREQLDVELLEACENSNFEQAKKLIKEGADAWYQDAIGWTCLHYAAEAGNDDLVRFLLRNGGVWKLTDYLGNTAGDVAFSLNLLSTYRIFTDEGVRSEMLAVFLDYDDEDENEGVDEPIGEENLSSSVIQLDDASPALIPTTNAQKSTATNNRTFLESRLTFLREGDQEICVDEEGNGVMMGWEKDIMVRTAELLCDGLKGGEEMEDSERLSILNVGFGLGLIDAEFQHWKPKYHVIIEPHPDVLKRMRKHGWYNRPGVHVFEGRWQDFVQSIEEGKEEVTVFDAVYFDTFSEHYKHLKGFFECLPNILKSSRSRFSFFNGLGGHSRLFWDVYTTVSELHLCEIGLRRVQWHELPIRDGGEVVWQGVTRRYWNVPGKFRIPVASLED